MTPRPFRFSLQVPTIESRRQWKDQARQAADLGFSILLTADHLDNCVSPLAPLVSAADTAPELRVGTMVLNNDLRHPSMLAREGAAIDLLTDGRLELGIGAGHAFPEYERNGLRFDAAAVRIARLAESVQVLRQLLDGETVTFHGEHYDIEGETCYPRTVQTHVPLLVGGGGNKTLAVAARYADTVGFTGLGRTLSDGNRHELSGFSPEAVTRQVAWVKKMAGDRIAELEFHALVQAVVVTDHPTEVIETLLPSFGGLSAEDVLATPYLLIGTEESIVESLLERRDRWGFSHYTVRPTALPTFGSVVAALSGR
jgi:probable F420-dependent oxidoreductase